MPYDKSYFLPIRHTIRHDSIRVACCRSLHLSALLLIFILFIKNICHNDFYRTQKFFSPGPPNSLRKLCLALWFDFNLKLNLLFSQPNECPNLLPNECFSLAKLPKLIHVEIQIIHLVTS
jgi:hypothetical protein